MWKVGLVIFFSQMEALRLREIKQFVQIYVAKIAEQEIQTRISRQSPHSYFCFLKIPYLINWFSYWSWFAVFQVCFRVIRVCVRAKSLRLCPSLCDPMDPPGSSVPRISQARIVAWVAMPSSRGSSWPRDQTHVSYVSCSGILLSYKEEHIWVISNEVDEPRTYTTEWSQSERERQISYIKAYIRNLER